MNHRGGIIVSFIYGLQKFGRNFTQDRSRVEKMNEKNLLNINSKSDVNFISSLGKILSSESISVHLFAASNSFMDLGTLGVFSGMTNGKCYFFNDYSSSKDFQHLDSLIESSLMNEYYFQSKLEITCPREVYITNLFSNGILSHNCVDFPITSKLDSICFEFGINFTISSPNLVFQIQFTSINNLKEKIISIFNVSFPVADTISEILPQVIQSASSILMFRRSLTLMLMNNPSAGVSFLIQKSGVIKRHFQGFSALFSLLKGILNNHFLKHVIPGGADSRFSFIVSGRSMNLMNSLLFFYPRLFDFQGIIFPLLPSSLSTIEMILHTNSRILIYCPINHNDTIESLKNNTFTQSLLEQCFQISGYFLDLYFTTSKLDFEPYLVHKSIENSKDASELIL